MILQIHRQHVSKGLNNAIKLGKNREHLYKKQRQSVIFRMIQMSIIQFDNQLILFDKI